jgi:phage tail tape-measure protein
MARSGSSFAESSMLGEQSDDELPPKSKLLQSNVGAALGAIVGATICAVGTMVGVDVGRIVGDAVGRNVGGSVVRDVGCSVGSGEKKSVACQSPRL